MKKTLLLFGLFLIFLNISFLFSQNNTHDLCRSWVYTDTKPDHHYVAADTQDESTMGYIFRKDGSLIKRHPLNWWEDPYETFGNFEGSWEWKEDSVLIMEYSLRGNRRVRETAKILELNPQKLSFERLDWKELR